MDDQILASTQATSTKKKYTGVDIVNLFSRVRLPNPILPVDNESVRVHCHQCLTVRKFREVKSLDAYQLTNSTVHLLLERINDQFCYQAHTVWGANEANICFENVIC